MLAGVRWALGNIGTGIDRWLRAHGCALRKTSLPFMSVLHLLRPTDVRTFCEIQSERTHDMEFLAEVQSVVATVNGPLADRRLQSEHRRRQGFLFPDVIGDVRPACYGAIRNRSGGRRRFYGPLSGAGGDVTCLAGKSGASVRRQT